MANDCFRECQVQVIAAAEDNPLAAGAGGIFHRFDLISTFSGVQEQCIQLLTATASYRLACLCCQ